MAAQFKYTSGRFVGLGHFCAEDGNCRFLRTVAVCGLVKNGPAGDNHCQMDDDVSLGAADSASAEIDFASSQYQEFYLWSIGDDQKS
jgi:hypothetical protein